MAQPVFTCSRDSNGATIRLVQKKFMAREQSIPFEEWAGRVGDRRFVGISRLLALLDEPSNPASRKDDGVFIVAR